MEFEIFDLGQVGFGKAWRFQKDIFRIVQSDLFRHVLVLCRHDPVITVGRRNVNKNIKVPRKELRKKRISVYEIERGGDVTYHGPGQITAYPVFNLNYIKKDIHFFLRSLEGLAMDFFRGFGIKADRREGLTGVWVDNRKIASVGIAVRNWITFHGMSLNIKKTDLDNFSLIRPCGMDIQMTSLETQLKNELDIDKVNAAFKEKCREFWGGPWRGAP